MTQMALSMSACKPSMMAGVATETMVESTRIMKNPMTSDHNAGQARISGAEECMVRGYNRALTFGSGPGCWGILVALGL
ncbi:hypothetical protein GCM10027404_19680 [Arthrobacter tumbae]